MTGIPLSEYGIHSFSVDYLGSVPLQEKVTSLAGLQNPLRDLYFAYKKMSLSRKIYSGKLEISHQGLKVIYQGEKGTYLYKITRKIYWDQIVDNRANSSNTII